MAKIVFALKSPHFYENIPHRKSYISTANGNVDDSRETMEKNKNDYFSSFFPTQDKIDSISNLANYEYVDFSIRKTQMNLNNDYPADIYPTDFEFWSNVNYAMIIHNNGFTEYVYIKERKNKNINANIWEFTFYIDIYNTYWIDVYQEYIKDVKENNKTISAMRLTMDRFDIINYDNKDYNVFNFLNSTESIFWNKEDFESKINSKIPIKTEMSLTPWTEFYKSKKTIITKSYELMQAYNNKAYTSGNTSLFGKAFGFLSTFISTTGDTTTKPWIILDSYSGMINSYWLAPITFARDDEGKIPVDKDYLSIMFDDPNTDNKFIWDGNNINNIISSPQTATIIQSPKPILSFGTRFPNDPPYNLWEDWTYPIRTRNRFIRNKNRPYGYTTNDYIWIQQDIKIGEKNIKTVVLKTNEMFGTSETLVENLANNPNNMLSSLCDERIPADDVVSKFYFESQKYDKIIKFKIELEPKILDEQLFNVVYSHYNQESLTISLKWYFYKNWDDLFKWKSIFLQGYQFVQPHLVSLMQMPAGGLYEQTSYSASTVLSSFFSPNQQTATDAQAQFLISNRSQMNTSLNNQKQNSIVGGVQGGASNILGGIAAGAIAGSAVPGIGTAIGAVGGAIGGISNAIFGGIKSSNQYTQMKAMQEAKLQDLANTPNASSDPVTESTFKLLNSYNGFYKVIDIVDIDKNKIWAYHAENGYLVNKQLILDTFASRIYYNYVQFPNLKLFLPNLNIINQYKEYFEVLLERGITFWHNFEDIHFKYKQNEVGNYNNENWEISIYKFLGKKYEIKWNTNNLITRVGVSTDEEIVNYNELINVTVFSEKPELIKVEIINYDNKWYTRITGIKESEGNWYNIILSADNAIESKIKRIIVSETVRNYEII